MNRLTRLLTHPFSFDHLPWSAPPGLTHRSVARVALLIVAALAVSMAIALLIQHARAPHPVPFVPQPRDPVAALVPPAPVVEPEPPLVLRVQGPPLIIRATLPRHKAAAR
jgi:hypothetical protein